VASGCLLWFENFTLRNFPKWVADAATAVHYYEAILASLSILIWHFYMTVFDPDVYPMDKAWLNGKASADHLKHTRPEYYMEIVSKQQEEAEASAKPKGPEEKSEPPA
jgi:cytochrome b subunit of formate dehydrogenase